MSYALQIITAVLQYNMVYVCVGVCVCACVLCACVHVCACVCACVCVCAVCVCVCVCACVCTSSAHVTPYVCLEKHKTYFLLFTLSIPHVAACEYSHCQDDKNKLFLICDYCKCKVMRPGYGRLVEKEVTPWA